MIFADLPAGEVVFVDANPFIYYFCADPLYASACDQLLRRFENQELLGFTSSHVGMCNNPSPSSRNGLGMRSSR